MRAFDNEKELDEYFRMHKKNHDFAIIFHEINENGNHGEPKLLNYTIQTRSNKFETEKIFVDDIYTANLKGKGGNSEPYKFFYKIKNVSF